MRVITGSARGRKLKALEGNDVRPTADRVKEAIFSMVQFEVEGSVMADLFCGSGQMGIEALSRGAKYVYFIDSAKASCETARENIAAIGQFSNYRVANMDALAFLQNCSYTFDLVFLDPPYHQGWLEKTLPLLEGKMSPGGKVLCEHEAEYLPPEQTGGLTLVRTYRYGKVAVTQYRAGEAEEDGE